MADYYSIITKKFTLRTSHSGWLLATRNLYNKILGFYYTLYLENKDIQELGSQNALRELEKRSIMGRDKKPVPFPLPWKKVPLYFRLLRLMKLLPPEKVI